MGLAIDGNNYKAKLKQQIENYSNSISTIQANPTDMSGVSGSAFGSTGLSQSVINDAKAGDIFSTAKKYGGNNTTASQSNQNQNNVSNSTSQFMTFVSQVKNEAVNKLQNVLNQLQAKLDSAGGAEQSPTAAPQTSGQTVTPKDNMPTDNQGSENKSANPSDSQKPNVGFGEEITTDNTDKTDKTDELENNPEKTEKENSVFDAESSSEIDKAAMKEVDKQAEEAQQKINEEAKRLNVFTAAANAA